MQFSITAIGTIDKSITFPITFNSIPGLIGVGIDITGVAHQQIPSVTVSGFRTSSVAHPFGTYGWLAIGK